MNILKQVQNNSKLSILRQLLIKSTTSEAVKTKAHLEEALRGASK